MLTRLTPSELPVSLEEAKGHLRVDGSVDDADISLKLAAAVGAVEQFTGPLVAATWAYSVAGFTAGASLFLPARKVAAVTDFRYQPLTGSVVVLSEDSSYYVDLRGASARFPGHPRLLPGPGGWPTVALKPGAPITIEFTAGYASRDDVPGEIKEAILLELGNMHRNRESIVMEGQVPRELDRGVRHLLQGYTIWHSGWAAE